MTIEWKELQEYVNYLKRLHSEPHNMMNEMEKMFLMNWDDEERVRKTMENIKITKSPDARNNLLGAVRLLVATDPQFSTPKTDVLTDTDNLDALELAAAEMWSRSGAIRGDPVHYDLILSMLLFGQAVISVTRTEDMVAYSKNAPKAYKQQIEKIARTTPYMFDVLDPRSCYPDLSAWGLNALYRETETTYNALINEYPNYTQQAGKPGRFGTAVVCDYWDLDMHRTWVRGQERPLIEEAHGLNFIPFVVQNGEGSRLFDTKYQLQPFLYTVWKSGLADRQNLALTVLYSMIFAMGVTPLFAETLSPQGLGITMDFSTVPAKVTIPPGAAFAPIQSKGIIDPSLMEAWQLAEGKITESTIYSQTLGEPIGANATFSMVALLHQAGRLPLISPQRKGSHAIAEAIKMSFEWWKAEGSAYQFTGALGDVDPAQIPEYLDMTAELDISLPQDQYQQAQIGALLAQGDDPILSKDHVRENILHINQPGQEQRRIWGEQAANLLARKYFIDQAMVIQQQEQAFMKPTPPPQMPPPGQPMPPEGTPPEGMPPEMSGQGLPPGMPQPGMPPMPAAPGQPMPMEGEA